MYNCGQLHSVHTCTLCTNVYNIQIQVRQKTMPNTYELTLSLEAIENIERALLSYRTQLVAHYEKETHEQVKENQLNNINKLNNHIAEFVYEVYKEE